MADIDRRAFALGAVALAGLLDRDVVAGEVGADCGLVEGFDGEREMVDVAAFASRRRAAHRAELSIHGHEVDQRAAGAEMMQDDFGLRAFVGAAEYLFVEAEPPVAVGDAQDRSEEHTSEPQSLMRHPYD